MLQANTKNVLEYIKEKYDVEPEFLWMNSPDTAAIRHNGTKKWFGALMMRLSKTKLGIDSDAKVDILNLKCDPMLIYSLVDNVRYFRGYHMNKEHWISVALNGTVPLAEVCSLIDMSYSLTSKKKKRG